jgi:magnesium transporter
MVRILFFTDQNGIQTDLAVDQLGAILQAAEGLLWVDFEGTPPEHDEPIMREIFHFHPLAIDDALQETHVPKLDDWGDYLYIVLHAVVFDPEHDQMLDTRELDIFVGDRYIVTHHDEPIQAIDRLWDVLLRDQRYLQQGADHLLYRLTDEVIASFMPVVEALDDEIDQTEDAVFGRSNPETLEHIFTLKRATLLLRRILAPQREVLNKLARDDFQAIDARDRIYFRDVYDHLVRMYDITENLRDLVTGSLDTYLSVVNNRMNDVMKTLTIITTLFMPLTFIAGFFGMNFFAPAVDLSTWTDQPVFILTLLIMLLMPLVMMLWIRRKGWM